MDLELTSVGREGAPAAALPAGWPRQTPSGVVLDRGSFVREELIVDPTVEHVVVLDALPAGHPTADVLLRVRASLPIVVGGDSDGEARAGWLRISGLQVFDAAGRPLRARFDADGEELHVRIAGPDATTAELPITVDPTLSSELLAIAAAERLRLGTSLAAADVNGDGRLDLVVGGPAELHEDFLARTLLYLGTSQGGLAASAASTSRTRHSSGRHGMSVAAADVDRDGYADLIVGDPWDPNLAGTVRLYRGGPAGAAATPSFAWSGTTGTTAEDAVGSALAVGDLNGDGWADLAVGAPGRDGAVAGCGATLVFYGTQNGFPSTPSWSASPTNQSGSRFGRALAIGDVDGDGYPDLAIGASRAAGSGGDEVGRVYLYRGSAAGLSASATAILAPPAETRDQGFGWTVAIAELTGDARADVLVGSPAVRASSPSSGTAYLFAGRSGGVSSTPAWSVTGAGAAGEQVGFALAAVDLDGDGRLDVLAGAPGADGRQGRVYVYRGTSGGLETTRAATMSAPVTSALTYPGPVGSSFGEALAAVGDVNGDGYPDVAVGAPGENALYGTVYLLSGGVTP